MEVEPGQSHRGPGNLLGIIDLLPHTVAELEGEAARFVELWLAVGACEPGL